MNLPANIHYCLIDITETHLLKGIHVFILKSPLMSHSKSFKPYTMFLIVIPSYIFAGSIFFFLENTPRFRKSSTDLFSFALMMNSQYPCYVLLLICPCNTPFVSIFQIWWGLWSIHSSAIPQAKMKLWSAYLNNACRHKEHKFTAWSKNIIGWSLTKKWSGILSWNFPIRNIYIYHRVHQIDSWCIVITVLMSIAQSREWMMPLAEISTCLGRRISIYFFSHYKLRYYQMAIIQTYSIHEHISSTINLSKSSMQKNLHTLMLMEMYSLQFVNGVHGAHGFRILDGIFGSSVKASWIVLKQGT